MFVRVQCVKTTFAFNLKHYYVTTGCDFSIKDFPEYFIPYL